MLHINESMKAEGRFRYGEYNVNYSEILSELIYATARFCENYASDLFISWEPVANTLRHLHTTEVLGFVFGIRENGVDGAEFVRGRLENPGCYGSNVYRAIYQLTATFDDDENVTLKLARISEYEARVKVANCEI